MADVELFCPTCKRFRRCEISKTNRHLLECLYCNSEYSLSESNTAIFGMTPNEAVRRKEEVMAHHRKTLGTKVTTICCSVRIKYKQAILAYVKREEGSVANITGKILEKWVEDNELLNLVQQSPVQEELEFKEDD